jgi:hypothetical protein
LTFPKSKVEIWEPGAGSALYTFTSTLQSIRTREIVTDGVGHFSFTLPTQELLAYRYNDIDLHDTVKIWLGYDSVPASPTWTFIGKVGNISAPMNTGEGYVRVVSGLSQGEILLNQLKRNKTYNAVDADTIVTEWATALSLGTSFTGDAADDIHVTMEIATKTYFDLMQSISDYWSLAGAGNQIKKDFYVDVGDVGHPTGHLIWKTRPMRTAGVSTLTVGTNILDYNVTRQKDPVKNDIVVYGKLCLMYPELQDEWTDDPLHANWNLNIGTALTIEAGDNKVGSHYVKATGDTIGAQTFCSVIFTFPELIHQGLHGQFDKLGVYLRTPIIATPNKMRIYLTDNLTDYFYTDIIKYGTTDWEYKEFPLGFTQTYSDDYPDGIWHAVGTPDWLNLQNIQFYQVWNNTDESSSIRIDDLWFKTKRARGVASNAGSKTTYGTRELEVIDDRLRTNSDCEKHAETLLYQKMTAPVQIEVTVVGDTNILVGDRLSVTIPAENITAADYDVISVEHSLTGQSFLTKATMVNSVNTREPLENTTVRTIIKQARATRNLSTELTQIGAR